jgi:uncharacterized protein (TIGR03437 family)
MAPGFHPTKSHRMDSHRIEKMRSHAIAVFLFLASAAMFPAQGALDITTTSLPQATQGVPYSAQLTVSGNMGNVTWSIAMNPGKANGVLPPTLTLSASGLISGTPTTQGGYGFTVNAIDQESNFASRPLSINVAPCGPTVTPASLPPADVNIGYAPVMFAVAGCPGTGPFTFSVQPNPPAPGLTLGDGTLRGTPTQVGTFNFYITASSSAQTLNPIPYSLVVNSPPTITTASPLPGGPVGVPYSVQIVATGGVPPYNFAMNNNPPGINISSAGLLSGTPTKAGTFGAPPNPITIEVIDSLGADAETPFQVTFGNGNPQIQVSPLSLTFNANGATPPAAQTITVVPAVGSVPPASFSLVVDSGQTNTTAPSWISVSPTSGTAPAGLVVNVNQGTLAAGTYPARIQILDSNNVPTDVAVTLKVSGAANQLSVSPNLLHFGARAAAPGIQVEDLLVSYSGAGSVAYNASVTGGSSWISAITPSSGQAALNAPVFLQIQVNTTGLQVGSYHDIIHVSSPAGDVDTPISLFVAADGPLLSVNKTGVLFQARQNGGSIVTDNVEILNIGATTSTVNWSADLVTGSNWLSLSSTSGSVLPITGVATPAAPGILTLALTQNATQLTPGAYYALIKITDPDSLNSPQYVITVLNLEPDSVEPTPYIFPAGIFFSNTLTLTGEAPSVQVLVNTSSTAPVPFQASTTSTNQGAWLSATPSSGTATGQIPGRVTVSANPAGLNVGIYTGNVSISMSGELQSVNVTFVVLPNPPGNPSSRTGPKAATSCNPAKVAITETGLPNNFAIPAGWPATLIVQLNDDCGSPVLDGNVIANFSNGDAPLALVGDSLGNYSATWQPGAVTSQMVVTLNAAAGTLKPATATLYGGIAQNQTPPPTLAPGGTLNDFNPVTGGALAPGMIAQVYGSGLATSPVSTGVLPLPSTFDNTFAQVGDYQAPFYFLSGDQLNVQIPAELVASQQLPMLLSVNNALTLPITLDIVPNAPGVLSAFDGPTPPSTQDGAHIVAQHLNGSSVTSNSPAKPGEYLVMYMAGLGATNPPVPSGNPAPGAPSTLAAVTVNPIVTVDKLPSNVVFAGLAPTFVGLYQIDFQVPPGASSGEDIVTVTQNGIATNQTLLPVGP